MTRRNDRLDSRANALIFLWDMMFQTSLFYEKNYNSISNLNVRNWKYTLRHLSRQSYRFVEKVKNHSDLYLRHIPEAGMMIIQLPKSSWKIWKKRVMRQLKTSKRERTFEAQPISICSCAGCRRQLQYRSEIAYSGGRRWARETWKIIALERWTLEVHAFAKL